MNRKLALAGSVSTAAVLVAGAAMVATLLSQGPEPTETPELAAPGADTASATVTSQEPIVVYQDEYEYVVTDDGTRVPVARSDGGEPEAVPSPPAAAPAAVAQVTGPAPTAAPTTTVAPRAATTTTTRPPGVPEDWPADKPIPPMPPNCRQPQLEDNGVWNCQH